MIINPLWDFCLVLIDTKLTTSTPVSDASNSGIVEAIGPTTERVKVGDRVYYGPGTIAKTFIRRGNDVLVLIEEGGIYAVVSQVEGSETLEPSEKSSKDLR